MKTDIKFFDIKKLLRIVVMVAVCGMGAGAYAYDDDDEDDCQYFLPAYALCSIHSYNVGLATNPTDASQISEMTEVIAMKSTLIAQQMKQQYDALNAMVKRFKTQLEKAVLTSKMEIMTGTTSSSSSSSSSSSAGHNGLGNAEDCDTVGNKNVYDCLTRNLNKILQAVEKDLTNARKQLVIDYGIAKDYSVCKEAAGNICDKCEEKFSVNTSAHKNDVKECVSQLRRLVDKAKTTYERENARSRYSDRDN